MTALDNALAAARLDAEKGTEFYNLFLNTPLFLPLTELPKENSREISPVLIEHEGTKYLMLFDEEKRLTDWAKRQLPFAELPGAAILQMMEPGILFILNLGSEFMHQFVADELAWLRGAMKPNREGESER